MKTDISWLVAQFQRHKLTYELVNNEAIRSGFRADTAEGEEVVFPLLAFFFEDLLGGLYARLSVNPLFERQGVALPEGVAERIAQLNHEAGWVRLTLDPDGDLELCGDLPTVLLSEQAFDMLLQVIVDYASVLHGSVQELTTGAHATTLSDEPEGLPDLAQRFADQYSDDLVLNYTPDSLERFEPNVDDDYRAFLQSENLLEANARAFGAYIGEVMVRQGSGRWEPVEPIEESAVVVGERRYQPLRMAHAFFESDQALRPSAIVRRALAR